MREIGEETKQRARSVAIGLEADRSSSSDRLPFGMDLSIFFLLVGMEVPGGPSEEVVGSGQESR